MTQSTFFADTHGSDTASKSELHAAIKNHLSLEQASFHTPGHKGRLRLDIACDLFQADLTELHGLDELANASGVLRNLQEALARAFAARRSFISVNGASAALTASITACSSRGTEILLPRNVHRSALNALIFTALTPVWYEPEWLGDWETWGAVSASTIEQLVKKHSGSLAAVLVCSPNYAGISANIADIAGICHQKNILLLVDEAHGSHRTDSDSAALQLGADLVVHSLHKTLSAPTQTGVLQIGRDCPIEDELLLACLNSLQSSSPSYLLMLGIEQCLQDMQSKKTNAVTALAHKLKAQLANLSDLEVLSAEPGLKGGAANEQKQSLTAEHIDPFHLLIRHKKLKAGGLYQALAEQGVYAETILGNAVLLLLGLNSNESDADLLLEALHNLEHTRQADGSYSNLPAAQASAQALQAKPAEIEQVLSPRKAFFAEYCRVKASASLGAISCDWIAPCPPGYPLLVPGQRITEEVLESLETDTSIRVVKHPQLEGDSDGPNTAS